MSAGADANDNTNADANAGGQEEAGQEQQENAQGQEQQENAQGQEQPQEEPGAPEKYEDFQVPEGVALDEGIMNDFVARAKELNLSQEKAQEMVDLGVKVLDNAMEAQREQYAQLRQQWVEELKTDQEFGGSNFDKTVEQAQQALRKFGDESLTELLEETGYGDNPALIKFLARITKATSEDNSASGDPPAVKKSREEILYDGT